MKQILSFPDILQADDSDCGVGVVQGILAYYGQDWYNIDLENELDVDKEWGVPTKNIVNFFKKNNFKVHAGTNMTIDMIKKFIDKDTPVILFIQAWKDTNKKIDWKKTVDYGHYVVVVGYDDEKIIFEDPAQFGLDYLTNDELEERWHGLDIKLKEHYGIVVLGKPEYNYKKITKMENNIITELTPYDGSMGGDIDNWAYLDLIKRNKPEAILNNKYRVFFKKISDSYILVHKTNPYVLAEIEGDVISDSEFNLGINKKIFQVSMSQVDDSNAGHGWGTILYTYIAKKYGVIVSDGILYDTSYHIWTETFPNKVGGTLCIFDGLDSENWSIYNPKKDINEHFKCFIFFYKNKFLPIKIRREKELLSDIPFTEYKYFETNLQKKDFIQNIKKYNEWITSDEDGVRLSTSNKLFIDKYRHYYITDLTDYKYVIIIGKKYKYRLYFKTMENDTYKLIDINK